ncbi:DUF2130 domain-containing protein [Propioniciclava flava]
MRTKTSSRNSTRIASRRGCEYAVLVSLLEPDNELYNTGIVDVSHRFQKMYVIRPQFFIQMITVLRNASMKALEYKAELALVKAQNVDITNFENELETFKAGFGRNYDLASHQLPDRHRGDRQVRRSAPEGEGGAPGCRNATCASPTTRRKTSRSRS